MKTCIFEGCDKPQKGRRWCLMHYTRWRRHGDPSIVKPRGSFPTGEAHPLWRGDEANYYTVHQRLGRDRGPASEHACVDACGKQAAHWSYDHTDPEERVSPDGLPYSLDQERYHPRCHDCHITLDRKKEAA